MIKMERCQNCGKQEIPYGIFRANTGQMVCQLCRHELDYDPWGRPVPPRTINSLFRIDAIIPPPKKDNNGNTNIELKTDCYYFDMCRERYNENFDCKNCQVYSKYRKQF